MICELQDDHLIQIRNQYFVFLKDYVIRMSTHLVFNPLATANAFLSEYLIIFIMSKITYAQCFGGAFWNIQPRKDSYQRSNKWSSLACYTLFSCRQFVYGGCQNGQVFKWVDIESLLTWRQFEYNLYWTAELCAIQSNLFLYVLRLHVYIPFPASLYWAKLPRKFIVFSK